MKGNNENIFKSFSLVRSCWNKVIFTDLILFKAQPSAQLRIKMKIPVSNEGFNSFSTSNIRKKNDIWRKIVH